MKKYMFFLLALTSISDTYAADFNIKVCALQSHSDGTRAYLMPCDNWATQNNCTSGGWIGWDMSQSNGQAMYSTALAALTTDSRLTVRLDGATCTGQYDTTSMARINRD